MMNNMPGGMKKHHESNEPARKLPDGQNVSLVQNYDSFMMVFAQNSSNLHRAVHQPITFFNFEVSHGGLNQSLKNYGFIRDAIFTCTHAQIT